MTTPTLSPAERSTRLASTLRIVVAVVAVAVCARVSVPIPGTPVPQSLQTLAVVVVGLTLGPRSGALALTLYVILGGLGAPIYADGAGGMESLRGPTAGYLVGFVVGAALAGTPRVIERLNSLAGAFVAAVAAHAVILGLGWLRLAAMLGAAAAFTSGVSPFLVGGAVKSAVAALVWFGFERLRGDLSSSASSVAPEG